MPLENENAENTDNKDKPTVTGVPVEVVQGLVEQVGRLADRVNTPAPIVAAPKPDPNVEREAKAARWKAMKDKANEIASSGDVAGAMEQFYQGIMSEAQSAPPPNPENDPAYQALLDSARRAARSDNKEPFDKYKAEIEAEMAKLPPEKRILARTWEEALGTVRARHFTEELEDATKKAREELEAEYAPPGVNAPNRARRGANDAPELTEIQRNVARSLGITHEQYAASLKETGDRFAAGQLVPIMKGETLDSDGYKIERGKF